MKYFHEPIRSGRNKVPWQIEKALSFKSIIFITIKIPDKFGVCKRQNFNSTRNRIACLSMARRDSLSPACCKENDRYYLSIVRLELSGAIKTKQNKIMLSCPPRPSAVRRKTSAENQRWPNNIDKHYRSSVGPSLGFLLSDSFGNYPRYEKRYRKTKKKNK